MNKYNKKQDVKAFVLEKKKRELPKGLRRDTTTGEGANITKLAKGGMPPRNKKILDPLKRVLE